MFLKKIFVWLLFSFSMTMPVSVRAASSANKSKPEIVKGATMRLAGRHTFAVTGGKKISWTLDREETSEDGGAPVLIKNVANAKGATATFDLSKTVDKETVYYVRAQSENFNDVQRVQVFPANARSSFTYKSAGNPDVRTYVVIPASLTPKTKVVLVMHGRSRNADGYIDTWTNWASQHDYIAVAPRFDDKNWAGDKYNIGNVFAGKDGDRGKNPEAQWSFTVAEGIHEQIRREFQIRDTLFDIWGHSAGGQFVHRFMLFKPNAKVRFAMSANSGWYTTPDINQAFPHGIKHPMLAIDAQDLKAWTNKPVIIFRGTADTERTENLSQTPEADAQGRNRFERAAFMYRQVKAFNPNSTWQIIDVPDAGHDQRLMAPAAQDFLRVHTTGNKMIRAE